MIRVIPGCIWTGNCWLDVLAEVFFCGQVLWLTPVIPTLWEAEGGQIIGGQELKDQPGQHGEAPSLLKIQNLARHGGGCL